MKKLSCQLLLALAAAAMLSVTACKKNNAAPPPTPKGILYFHIHSNIDTSQVESGTIATDAAGRRYQLNIAAFYMSGITLRKADGSVVVLNNTYILKDLAGEEYYADSVIAGNYVSVSFNVGIDAATNLTYPSSYPASSPLAGKSPNMWFGTPAQGYIFMNIQGASDTTPTQTGALNYPFNYRLGTSSMLRNVSVDEAFTVTANQPAVVHFVIDYGKVLSGIDLKLNNTATPWLNNPVATQIANNIPLMISHEH